MVVGFGNGVGQELSTAAAEYGLQLSEAVLTKCAEQATTPGKFIDEVAKNTNDKFGRVKLPARFAEVLAARFEHIRLEADTLKAVHRLCLLGLVEDYTIGYSAKNVVLHLAPRQTDEQLRATYQAYLSRYMSPDRARAEAASVDNREGDIFLQKLVSALLLFNESEIKAKRLRALEAMDAACQIGLNNQLGLKDQNLGEHLDLYFNSKYARQEFLPADTAQGKDFDQEIIWKYLAYMNNPPATAPGGKERDNIKHLRGACSRLLSASPYNGAFLLLGAFATLFLELTKPAPDRIEALLDSAQRQLLSGFEAYDKGKQQPLTELVAFAQRFAREVGKFHRPVGEYVLNHVLEPMQLQAHLRWLTGFNQRFIDLPTTPTH